MQLKEMLKIAEYQDENWETTTGYISSVDISSNIIKIGNTEFLMNTNARKQLFERLGIVGAYSDLNEKKDSIILQDVVDYCLANRQKTPSKIIYDINNNSAKALKSKMYKPVGNINVLKYIADKYEDNFNEKHSYISDERMYTSFGNIKTIDIKSKRDVGDVIGFGLQVWNSDVGLSSLGIGQFMIRLVCTNGMTGKDSINVSRISHSSNNILEKLAIGMERILDINKIVKVISRAMDRPAIVENINDFYKVAPRIPQRHRDGIIRAYNEEPVGTTSDGVNGWGIYNAVTRYNSHIFPGLPIYNRFESQELMSKAYQLLTL